MTTKEKVINVLDSLEDDVALEVVIDRLYLLRKIELGIAQADAGQTIEHQEFMDELEAEDAN
jgi:predicted transcriptional regulator